MQSIPDRRVSHWPGPAGQRLEQRSEEQALVNGARPCLVTAVLRVELLGRRAIAPIAVAEDARQPGASIEVGWQRVRLLFVPELESVLHEAEELVGSIERGRVAMRDVAGGDELGQGVERRRAANRRIVPAVHELKQLYRELDVANAAPPALQLPVVEPPPVGLALGACLHSAEPPRGVRAEDVRPGERPRGLDERRSGPGVTRDRPGLDQS